MKDEEERLRPLLQRSFDGDQLAYAEVLERLRSVLRVYIRRQLYRIGRSECDAEDIAQDALIAIHAKWYTYDGETPVTAWAHAIARYKLVDFLRKTTNSSRDICFHEIEDAVAPQDEVFDAVLTLKRLVSALPANLRQPLELVRIKGLSIKEASAATGLSEASVKVNIHRAVRKIAKAWKLG